MKIFFADALRYIVLHRLVFVWVVFAVTLEFIAQFYVDARPYFAHFWIPLLLFIVALMFLLSLRSIKTQAIWSCLILLGQAALIFGGVFLYMANGSAFQQEMLNMRNDAFGTMESIPVPLSLNLILIFTFIAFMFFAIIVTRFDRRKRVIASNEAKMLEQPFAFSRKKAWVKPWPRISRKQIIAKRVQVGLALVFAIVFCILPIIDGAQDRRQPNYHFMLTRNSGDRNQMRGITANIMYEMVRFGASSGVSLRNMYQLPNQIGFTRVDEDGYAYENDLALTSDFNGVAEGNNLVMIVAESWDPNILERYDLETTRKLFPYAMRLIEGGIYATNFRVKEKTDTAEGLSLLGSLPSEGFIHYDFHRNAYPFALPNKLRDAFVRQGHIENREDMRVQSFHQNTHTFYNRHRLHPQLGFDKFWGSRQMRNYDPDFVDTWNVWNGLIRSSRAERTLDSETVYRMRYQMFPTDGNPFFTWYISFVKHGFYRERRNLGGQNYANRDYYAMMDEMGVFPRGSADQNRWRTYAAAAMDFDFALGYMYRHLEHYGLLDNTTIVVVSDHESYYNNLSRYGRNYNTARINEARDPNLPPVGRTITSRIDPDLFRIPLVIYCRTLNKHLETQNSSFGREDDGILMRDGGRRFTPNGREIHRFTTMQDVVPTIFDMFGIPAWRKLYFGHTIFRDDIESINFSRVYNFFFNDRLSFFSKNRIDVRTQWYEEGDLELFVDRAKIHLDKLFWLDRVYHGNFFRRNPYVWPVLR
ncbi:MAG: sulfatase-like hydrolase/transferase [Firmicutes bacterium]|nr:sulfatase-like hydrolase/transferase [Bacillota bacterium]